MGGGSQIDLVWGEDSSGIGVGSVWNSFYGFGIERLDRFRLSLGSISDLFGIALAPVRDIVSVGFGSSWGWFGVERASMRARFEVELKLTWDRYRVGFRSM